MINIKETLQPIIEDKEAYDLFHAGLCRIFISKMATSDKYDASFGGIIYTAATDFLNSLKNESLVV